MTGPGPDDERATGDGHEGADEAPWFTTSWPDVQPQIRVTVSLETLLGLADDPGELNGYGPVAAEIVRDLASRGIWRCAAVDGEHGTVLGLGTRTYTPRYTPGARLVEFVEHATPTCGVPGCGVATWRCDLDHARPYAAGGPTCDCNVRPLCRRHHRLKTAGLLLVTFGGGANDPPGTWTYTTRTGRAYRAIPHVPLPQPSAVRAARTTAPTATEAGGAEDDEPPAF